MKRIFLAVLLMLAALAAGAGDARRYAVLSLVGDKLLIVQREMATGSHLDRNTRVYVNMPDATLDREMLLAIDEAIRRAEPSSTTMLLAARDPALFAAAARELDGAGNTARIYEAVKPVLVGTNATHLVLVTKQRHAARLRIKDGSVGSGFLEGLGFYIDHGTFMRTVDTNEAERGFIAPFAYFNVSLIDVAQGKVISEEHIIGSMAHSTTNINIGNAWESLTAQEKADSLAKVIREETQQAVPRILAKS